MDSRVIQLFVSEQVKLAELHFFWQYFLDFFKKIES